MPLPEGYVLNEYGELVPAGQDVRPLRALQPERGARWAGGGRNGRRRLLRLAAAVALVVVGCQVVFGGLGTQMINALRDIGGRDASARPVTFALHPVTVRSGRVARFRVRIVDPDERRVRVAIVVSTRRGQAVHTYRIGTLTTGRAHTVSVRCRLRPGTYVYRVIAIDAAGMRCQTPGRNTLTVRR